MSLEETAKPSNFIRHIIDADLAAGKNKGKVATRFPPEPNGYLHIGHAKSIVLNFGIAQDYSGTCNLRFDDTNPHKENIDFVNAIQKDVQWLGYKWSNLYYASDYFEQLYTFGVELIEKGKAYVCDLNADQIREYRGTLTEPGKNSPFRDRSIAENLDLFARMRAGEFRDGERVLRAKIDMASSNINLRDPTLYRIRHGVIHHQTGEAWCIYPMYDYAHPVSDAIEGITHSICTLEFEDHRPFYDWVLDNITIDCHPQQIEFSRLNLQYTVVSKRKLTELVDQGHVAGWDDPRMPTLAGLRRRGYTPEAIRVFCERIGVTKSDNSVEMGMLESAIRDDLNARAPRRMAVLHPLKVVITNYPEAKVEQLEAANHPQDESMGKRTMAFCRELYIERADFEEVPPKKFKRLIPGGEVRLRNSYVIRCDEIIKNNQGEIIELRCSYDTKTLNVNPEGRKVQGVIHWVSARHAMAAEVRLYDRLFTHATPDDGKDGVDYKQRLNPDSLRVLSNCFVESSLATAQPGERFQFEREGYFCRDINDSAGKPVFNMTVGLKDSWVKEQQK
ncbi:MAG: glutaminyl-tRNA synthetase [Pseudomonadota bacterium]|nr:glutaminyl-tRNA synthetase [Pseudomonadota bacterium]